MNAASPRGISASIGPNKSASLALVGLRSLVSVPPMNQKSHFLSPIALVVSALCLSSTLAAETEPAKYPGLKNLQFVTEADTVVPGETFTAGLWFEHEKGYHTYWKSPGIVGVAAVVKWEDLPDGVEIGEIQGPAPQKTLMATLTAWGYETDTCLLMPITLPKELGDRDSITLKGRIGWMCCATSCHPGWHDFSLTLPVGKSVERDAKWTKRFEESRARFPRPAPEGWEFAAREIDARTIQLEISGPEPIDWTQVYFFCHDNQVDSDEPQLLAVREGGKGAVLTFTRPEFAPENPAELSGVLHYPEGWPGLDGLPWMIASAPWAGYEEDAKNGQDSDTEEKKGKSGGES